MLISGVALLSPYYKANTAIGHAIGLVTQNIGGVRPGVEDMAAFGHEGRFGMVLAESEEESPWEPLHVQYGLKKEDSAISGFWPHGRQFLMGIGSGVQNVLSNICKKIVPTGFDPGSALIMTPANARELASGGWTKKEVISYIAEFARRPAEPHGRSWIQASAHQPKEMVPVESNTPMRLYFSTEHLMIVVSGGTSGAPALTGIIAYTGGGDYGGPVTKKIELPKNWNSLVKKYKDIVPVHAPY
jgi:hypothetical protein